MNWIVAALAVFTAVDVPHRIRQLRAVPPRERVVVAAGLVAAALALAAVATPLLNGLDISGPNLEIGAGVVLALYSVLAIARWDDTAPPPSVAGGVAPLLFPIVLTPAVGVVVLAVSARNGLLVPVIAAIVAAVLIAWNGADSLTGRRPLRMLSGAVGVVVGIAMIVDGAFAV